MHSTCPDGTTKAACRYVSPSLRPLTPEEAGVRALAYAIKDESCDEELVRAAALPMAKLIVGESGYLVPVPNHLGRTHANYTLAKAIGFILDGTFRAVDVLTRNDPGIKSPASQCERHRSRQRPLEPGELGIRRASALDNSLRLTGTEKIYFVDNVITSGNTIEACRRVFFGLGTGLVYADAHYDAKD